MASYTALNHDERTMSIRSMRSSRTEAIHPALEQLDPYTAFLYKPHTVTSLLVGIAVLIYSSGVTDPRRSPADADAAAADSYLHSRTGIVAAICVFLGYSVLQGPRAPLIRPHPALWRFVHGVVLLYLLFLVYLLYQTVDEARQFLKHLYPSLGVPLDERAYGGDCRLYIPGSGINWDTLRATVFDEFVIAHTLGWWGKALIMRSYPMLWVLSISFELMELTFQHMLPNFNECWWDSWILDVGVCNLLGMVSGMMTLRFFKSKEYNWQGLSQQTGLFRKVKRSILQFTPYSVDQFSWRLMASPVRLLQCLLPVVVFLLFEVNAFFLKFILWVPPRNMLNTYRLLILFLGAIPAVKEYYQFIEAERDPFNKLGASAWLIAATAVVETCICVKHGRGMFPEPWPQRVIVFWSVIGGAFSLFLLGWSVQYYLLTAKSSKSKSQ